MSDDDREQWEAAQALSEEQQLQMGRDMVSSANGGRPDFEGFIEALRAEAAGTEAMFGRSERAGEIDGLRALADRVEQFAERYGFV